MSVWVCLFVRYSPIFCRNTSGCVTAGENMSINDLVVLGRPGFLFSPASSAGRVPAAHSSTRSLSASRIASRWASQSCLVRSSNLMEREISSLIVALMVIFCKNPRSGERRSSSQRSTIRSKLLPK